MIRVVEGRAPAILRKPDMRGPKDTTKLCKDYDDGEREFKFKSDIYGAKPVKKALLKAQHEKCCFCESKIPHVYHGDVEHFRPKGGCQQGPEDDLIQPGYYWLAYCWKNLFLSCAVCNQIYKKNLFPLEDPDQRARSHHDVVSTEHPLFIDPAVDDPGEYLEFNEEYARAIDGNERGSMTIAALGLNRDDLVEMRRTRLRRISLAR